MITLRNCQVTSDRRLDRIESDTVEHFEKYPLLASTPATDVGVAAGFVWYSAFDNPRQITLGSSGRSGSLHIIGDGDLGSARGGHATCLRPWRVKDSKAWWLYYNQGLEGRCVEFSTLRLLTLANRKRYDITSRFHYWQAQKADEWEGGSYPGASPVMEGTSVRAGLEVLRTLGAVRALPRGRAIAPDAAPALSSPDEGIAAYRWATDWADVRRVLGVPNWLPGVPLLNSWGTSYPQQVILADAAGERLLREGGEFGVVTDR